MPATAATSATPAPVPTAAYVSAFGDVVPTSSDAPGGPAIRRQQPKSQRFPNDYTRDENNRENDHNHNHNDNHSNNNDDDDDDDDEETCLFNMKIAESAIDMSPYCLITTTKKKKGHQGRTLNDDTLLATQQSSQQQPDTTITIHSPSSQSDNGDDNDGDDNDYDNSCHDNSNNTRREYCSSALLQQLKSDGFALVKGTGIPREVCQNALRVTNSFLQEADESVRTSCLSVTDRARRGYSPINSENFASLLGEDGPNDLVRKFRMGPPTIGDSTLPSMSTTTKANVLDRHNGLPVDHDTSTPGTMMVTTTTPSSSSSTTPSSSSLLRPNVWPVPSNNNHHHNNNNNTTNGWDEETCQDFQSTIEVYYDRICAIANAIVHAICDGLIHEQPTLGPTLQEAFASSIRGNDTVDDDDDDDDDRGGIAHTSILTLLGYRTGTRHKKSISQPQQTNAKTTKKNRSAAHPLVAAHTDVGVITVLLYDGGDCAVLQRQVNSTSSSTMKAINNNDGSGGIGIGGSPSASNEDNINSNILLFEDVLLPKRTVPKDPIFVVNVADCLSDLTRNYLPSTIHRVMPQRKGTAPRNCLALFVGLDPNQPLTLVVDQNENVIDDNDNVGNYDDKGNKTNEKKLAKTTITTTYETWRKNRIARSQKVLRRSTNKGW
jgi:isopenicillin N synthase-like dioxygenase